MSCLYPVKIAVKSDKAGNRYNYKGRKSNQSYGLSVPCGHCVNCIEQKTRQWTYRLIAQNHTSKYDKMAFITLTYDDEHLPENGSCCYADISKFIKRIRRHYEYHNGGKLDLKYYGCTEYGGEKGRCHAHLLLFGIDYNDLLPTKSKLASHNTKNCISPFWDKGLLNYGTDVSLQDSRLIRYVTKYIDKLDSDNLYRFCEIMGIEKPKVYKSLGLGADYIKQNSGECGDIPTLGGMKVNLPPYWKKKLGLDNLYTQEDIKIMLLKEKEKRAKIMLGQSDTNENYADVVTRCKRGAK